VTDRTPVRIFLMREGIEVALGTFGTGTVVVLRTAEVVVATILESGLEVGARRRLQSVKIYGAY
jgi:hypothetical protein